MRIAGVGCSGPIPVKIGCGGCALWWAHSNFQPIMLAARSPELRRPPAPLIRRLLRSSLQKYWRRHCSKVTAHARLCLPSCRPETGVRDEEKANKVAQLQPEMAEHEV